MIPVEQLAGELYIYTTLTPANFSYNDNWLRKSDGANFVQIQAHRRDTGH